MFHQLVVITKIYFLDDNNPFKVITFTDNKKNERCTNKLWKKRPENGHFESKIKKRLCLSWLYNFV